MILHFTKNENVYGNQIVLNILMVQDMSFLLL